VIPAPAPPPTDWSVALPSLDVATFPSAGVSDSWARLSAELDRLEELRAKWASDSTSTPAPDRPGLAGTQTSTKNRAGI